MLKLILHVSENDSKYRDVAPLRHKGKENKLIYVAHVLSNLTGSFRHLFSENLDNEHFALSLLNE